jgi:hypothetical protein
MDIGRLLRICVAAPWLVARADLDAVWSGAFVVLDLRDDRLGRLLEQFSILSHP